MSVKGKTHNLWIARNADNGELLALMHSLYDVPDSDFTSQTNVKYLTLHALDIYGKSPSLEVRHDFVEAEWETWYAFKLVPVIKITVAGKDNPVRWIATVE